MKTRTITYALVAACGILLAGCNPDGKLRIEEFNSSEGIGLKIGSLDIITYDPLTSQLAYNETDMVFRVNDDNMADYFILKCYQFPSSGATVKADLTYTTDNDIKTRNGISFEVTKTDDASGKVWLWNSKNKIGAVVKILR